MKKVTEWLRTLLSEGDKSISILSKPSPAYKAGVRAGRSGDPDTDPPRAGSFESQCWQRGYNDTINSALQAW